jgi:hypothetical protein
MLLSKPLVLSISLALASLANPLHAIADSSSRVQVKFDLIGRTKACAV